MDADFLFCYHPKLMCLSPFNIRRDPRFSAQLYFMSFDDIGSNKFGLYLYQVIASSTSENDPSVRTVRFLKRKTSSALALPSGHSNIPPMPDITFAIDEPAAKLYLSFGNDGAETKLRVMDIEFDPADHLGYRRMRVQERDQLFAVKIPSVRSVLGAIKISVTGNVFGQYTIMPTNSNKTYKSTVALFGDCKAKNSVIRARISDHKFTRENASRKLNPRASMFTKLDHLLILYGFGEEDKPQTNKSMFLVSYDTDLNLVRSLEFNPAEFVTKFLPADIIFDFYEARRPFSSESHVVGSCLDIVGHTYKYVIFSFNGYILVVKWPSDWYTRKNLPPIQLSRVIDLGDFVADGEDYSEIDPMPLTLTDTHLYTVFRPRGKPFEVKRLSLGARFKDYRHCANCGEVEKSKRRNKHGKRIAEFKVCRLCKKKNFHLFYLDPAIACHYCSDECQKKHWKIHKTVHKRSKLDRKTASAKTVEEKF